MKRMTYFLCMLLFVACSTKEVVYDHPMSAEFAPDELGDSTVTALYIDFTSAQAIGDSIKAKVGRTKPEVILVATDGTVDGIDAGQWIEANYKLLGGSSFYSDCGYFATTSTSDAYFDKFPASSGDAFIAETAGWSFVLACKASSEDKALVEKTIQTERKCDWVVVTSSVSSLLPNYAFSDCMIALTSGREAFGKGCIYAGPGSLSYIDGLQIEGNSFHCGINVRRTGK